MKRFHIIMTVITLIVLAGFILPAFGFFSQTLEEQTRSQINSPVAFQTALNKCTKIAPWLKQIEHRVYAPQENQNWAEVTIHLYPIIDVKTSKGNTYHIIFMKNAVLTSPYPDPDIDVDLKQLALEFTGRTQFFIITWEHASFYGFLIPMPINIKCQPIIKGNASTP